MVIAIVHNRLDSVSCLNPTVLRKAKIVCNFGLSECNRVKEYMPRLVSAGVV